MQKKEIKDKKKIPSVGTGAVVLKQIYEGNVAARAIDRAGKNKNLKGHIFEYLTVDKINASPSNILKRRKAVLTKSPIAVRDDILVKQGGKIVKRMQLKDTPQGIKDTVSRVGKKQYAGTNLIGTKETAKAYGKEIVKKNANGTKITQKMATNGISSQQTELIAAKVLGGNVAKQGRAIVEQASRTGVKTAVFSAAAGTAANAGKVFRKEITVKRAIGDMAKDSAVNATSTAVGDMVATGVTIAVASTPAAPAAGVIGTAAGVGAAIATDNVIRNTDISKMAKKVKKSRMDGFNYETDNSSRNSDVRYGQPVMG